MDLYQNLQKLLLRIALTCLKLMQKSTKEKMDDKRWQITSKMWGTISN